MVGIGLFPHSPPVVAPQPFLIGDAHLLARHVAILGWLERVEDGPFLGRAVLDLVDGLVGGGEGLFRPSLGGYPGDGVERVGSITGGVIAGEQVAQDSVGDTIGGGEAEPEHLCDLVPE